MSYRRTSMFVVLAAALTVAAFSLGGGHGASSSTQQATTTTTAPRVDTTPNVGVLASKAVETGEKHQFLRWVYVATMKARIEAERQAALIAYVRRAAQRQAETVVEGSGSSRTVVTGTGSPSQQPFLVCTRQHESGGNYAIDTGNGYHGAYQFLQSTWDSVAASHGRPDLVGVNPAHASVADQDSMALALYGDAGNGPWEGRC